MSSVGNRTLLLFDWVSGGHHEYALKWFAKALASDVDVCIAAPDESLGRLDPASASLVPLGDPRPDINEMRHFSRIKRQVGAQEVRLLRQAMKESRATHGLHLFGDAALRSLSETPPLPLPLSLLLFRPRSHYPAAYQSQLTGRERLVGWAFDRALGKWMKRQDAHVLLTYDREAAWVWQKRFGLRAEWLTEAPVPGLGGEQPREPRRGFVLAGSIAPRKGIDLLVSAARLSPWPTSIRFVGAIAPNFRSTFNCHVQSLRSVGTDVKVLGALESDDAYLGVIRQALCSIIPYPRHIGMSRVLLESAKMHTPVIAHDWGLLGYLVRRYGLGMTVDCHNSREFRSALDRMAEPSAQAEYAPNLTYFAEQYTLNEFKRRLRTVWTNV